MPDSLDKVGKSTSRTKRTAKSADKSAGRSGTDAGDVPDVGETRFHDVLECVSGSPSEKRLETILGEIRELAEILGRRRFLEDLEEYRLKVGEFLRVYLDDVLDVRQAAGRRGFSKRKQLLVVKRVNVELEELSKFVLGGAEDFKILKELVTIEGLLLDLYR